MRLKTHKELLQHIGDEVLFEYLGRNISGRLFLDTSDEFLRVFILNNRVEGCNPYDPEWERQGYKYSRYISSDLSPYECDNKYVNKIETIPIDYNKLEELLCF